MARLQILHLPDNDTPDVATLSDPPRQDQYALVIDQTTEQEAELLTLSENAEKFVKAIGARGVLVYTGTLDVI
ncbi:hypothetical protein ACWEFL_15825 [Streptomyces sp. NPDC004838]